MPIDLRHTLAFDIDGSLSAQSALRDEVTAVVECADEENDLRLFSSPAGHRRFNTRLAGLRSALPGTWISFLGSGDFHHLSLSLLESLPRTNAERVALVVIDNHPDWFCDAPREHCGNWVAGAMALPFVHSVTLVGQDSSDLRGYKFRRIPFDALCDGRLRIFPYRRGTVFVPRRWPDHFPDPYRRGRLGTALDFRTVEGHGIERICDMIIRSLYGIPVYLSVDKDCVREDELRTDWEGGGLTRTELIRMVTRLRDGLEIVGLDVCGERGGRPLRGWWKRADAMRLGRWKPLAPSETAAHEALNLEILARMSDANTKTQKETPRNASP